jgi:hypothetical protein
MVVIPISNPPKRTYKEVLRSFCNEAKKLGFKGKSRMYRNREFVQDQIQLEKSTFGDNHVSLSLKIYLFRGIEERDQFFEMPDIRIGEQSVTLDFGQRISAALNADILQHDSERAKTFREFLEESAEPWFHSIDDEVKVKAYALAYATTSSPQLKPKGTVFRPIYDYLFGPNWVPPKP